MHDMHILNFTVDHVEEDDEDGLSTYLQLWLGPKLVLKERIAGFDPTRYDKEDWAARVFITALKNGTTE